MFRQVWKEGFFYVPRTSKHTVTVFSFHAMSSVVLRVKASRKLSRVCVVT